MDYLDKYIDLMETAKARGWTKKTAPVYTEGHHILPRSWMPNNYIVQLTAKEHFVAHRLLAKAFPEDQAMAMAYWMMCSMKTDKQVRDFKVTSSQFSYARESMSNAVRQSKIGSKLSDVTKRKISEIKKGSKLSAETKSKMSKSHMGKTITDATRAKLSKSNSGSNNSMFDHKVYNWSHVDHGVVSSTRTDLNNKYETDSISLGRLLSGKIKSHRGWKLA